MNEKVIYIDALTVVEKFGYLIAGGGKKSGLEFAKRIIHCNKDCESYRETCASSVASTIDEIQIDINGCCHITESLT